MQSGVGATGRSFCEDVLVELISGYLILIVTLSGCAGGR